MNVDSRRPTRPNVLVDTADRDPALQATLKNLADADLYQRGENLVRLIDPPPAPDGIEGEDERTVITDTYTVERFGVELTKRMCFTQEKFDKKTGETTETPIGPPNWLVTAAMKERVWRGVRKLEGVVEAPVMDARGAVISCAGYDASTGLYLQPRGSIHVPHTPTDSEVADARELLDEWL